MCDEDKVAMNGLHNFCVPALHKSIVVFVLKNFLILSFEVIAFCVVVATCSSCNVIHESFIISHVSCELIGVFSSRSTVSSQELVVPVITDKVIRTHYSGIVRNFLVILMKSVYFITSFQSMYYYSSTSHFLMFQFTRRKRSC